VVDSPFTSQLPVLDRSRNARKLGLVLALLSGYTRRKQGCLTTKSVLTRPANAQPGSTTNIAVNIAKMRAAQWKFHATAVTMVARSRAYRKQVKMNLRLIL
jgi:hypothetical protein